MKLNKAIVFGVLVVTGLLATIAGRVVAHRQNSHIIQAGRALTGDQPARGNFQRLFEPTRRPSIAPRHSRAVRPPIRPAGSMLAIGGSSPEFEEDAAHDAFPFLGFFDEEPGELRAPDDAAPIEDHDPHADRITKRIIEQELPGASEEERKIWLEELKGLPEGQLREILRLRKGFGHGYPRTLILPPFIDVEEPAISEPKPVPEYETHSVPIEPFDAAELDFGSGSIQPSLAALRMARDVVLNNIANASTPAFKRSRVQLADLPYHQVTPSGRQDMQGQLTAMGTAVGVGVQIAGTIRDHRPGLLEQTGNPLDIAIVGDGFFQVQGGPQILYTRAGTFALNADGMLTLASAERGRVFEPALTVSKDSTEISISREGIVSVRQPSDPNLVQVGQIQLARFVNPAGLEPRGDNLFAATDGSGAPVLGGPGAGGAGELRQGFLEGSNVDLVAEMLQLRRFEQQIHALLRAGSLISPAREPVEFLVPTDRPQPSRIADPRLPAQRR